MQKHSSDAMQLYYPQMMQYIYHDFDFAFRLHVSDLFANTHPRTFEVFIFDPHTPHSLFSSQHVKNLIWRETLILCKSAWERNKPFFREAEWQ